MAVANAHYEFLYVEIGTNGRVSDGGVFSKTSFNKALTNKKLNIPDPSPLTFGSEPLPFVFVADDAFPLSPNIMKPYNFRDQSPIRRVFNYRLSRARRVVENAFGIVSRFRVFKAPIALHPDKVETIVLASCALHNFLRRYSKGYVNPQEIDIEDVSTQTLLQGSWHSLECSGITGWGASNSRNPSVHAKHVREEYAKHFSEEGKVSWQNHVLGNSS